WRQRATARVDRAGGADRGEPTGGVRRRHRWGPRRDPGMSMALRQRHLVRRDRETPGPGPLHAGGAAHSLCGRATPHVRDPSGLSLTGASSCGAHDLGLYSTLRSTNHDAVTSAPSTPMAKLRPSSATSTTRAHSSGPRMVANRPTVAYRP